MLQPCLSLQLIQTDAFLQQGLHFCAHLCLSVGLCPRHSFLLQADALLLLHNFIGFRFQVYQYLILALDLLLLVHNLLPQAILERDEVIWVAREALIARCRGCTLVADGQVLAKAAGEDVTSLESCVQLFGECHDLLEGDSCRRVQKDGEVLNARNLQKLTFSAEQERTDEVEQHFWLAVPHEEVIDHLQPILSIQHLSHQ